MNLRSSTYCRILVTAALVAAVTFLFAGCADDNSDVPAARVHPLSWSEPTNFFNANFHGKVVVAQGNEECKQCHGLNLEGDSTIPGCTDCHDDINGGHLPGMGDPAVHGPRALANFQLCKMCHGNDYLGGIAGVSCAACHTIPWPHPSNSTWMNSSNAGYHGLAADTALERADCAICHGANFQGGSTLVGCFTCHFDETGARYPAGLTHHNNHQRMTAYVVTCNTCHFVNRSYGNPPNACHDCHGDGD